MSAPARTGLSVATVMRGRHADTEIESALAAGGVDVSVRAHDAEGLSADAIAEVDAVVLAIDGDRSALDEVALVRRQLPSAAIVAVTGTLDRRALRDLLGAGVDGIVL